MTSGHDIIYTPNETYSFFENKKCKLCKFDMKISYESFKLGQIYYGGADCIANSHQYHVDIIWIDPKKIEICREEIYFNYNDKSYHCRFDYNEVVDYDDGKYVSIKKAFIGFDDGSEEVEVDLSLFDDVRFDKKSLSTKIDNILLLK